jgi:hypothetical protein
MSLRSWVAFDADGFPVAFADADRVPLWEFEFDYPEPHEIREVDGPEREALLAVHAGQLPLPKSAADHDRELRRIELAAPQHAAPPIGAANDLLFYSNMLVERYGFEAVADAVAAHSPIPDVRLSRVDDPPTAERAGDKQSTADPSRYGVDSLKGQILLRFGQVGGTSDADEIIEWWTYTHPDAPHGRIESLRRRVDELFSVGHLIEVDTSGTRRRLALDPIQGYAALRSLNETGWSKGKP